MKKEIFMGLMLITLWYCGGCGDDTKAVEPGDGEQPADMVDVVAPQDKHRMKVMTYNVRYDNGSVLGKDSWSAVRKDRVVKLLREQKPDLMGMQEVLYNQLMDLTLVLTDYAYVGVGREDGEKKGEFAPVFYRKDRFELMKNGHFWYSETPDVPSITWNAACIRICTWAKLKDKQNDKIFYVFNSHYDHESAIARKNSAELMLKKIDEISENYPVMATGDFNAVPSDGAIQYILKNGLLKDAYGKTSKVSGCSNTFHNYEGSPGISRIDFIFVTSKISVDSYTTLDGKIDNYYSSDHFPVSVEVEIP